MVATAQEWFPIGSSWHYNQIHFGIGESFVFFEVTGEVKIQGKNTRIIQGSCNCGVPDIGGYLYQEGEKIYVFNFELDSFVLLYDFTLETGDTLVFKGYPPLIEDGRFLIDSITYLQVGSQNLRVQHVTTLSNELSWGDKIIERIGSNGCLYPQVNVCDPHTGGLRCYEDQETGFINFQIPLRPCTYVTGIETTSRDPLVQLFPNPSPGRVDIRSEMKIEDVNVYNNLLMPVYHKSAIFTSDFEVDVSSFPDGIYHLQLLFSNHEIMYRSIVIQK